MSLTQEVGYVELYQVSRGIDLDRIAMPLQSDGCLIFQFKLNGIDQKCFKNLDH